jgi:hypothetical protein
VQLVARQPLELVILVRVQAPEPISNCFKLVCCDGRIEQGYSCSFPGDALCFPDNTLLLPCALTACGFWSAEKNPHKKKPWIPLRESRV